MLDQALSAIKTINTKPALVIFLSLSLLNLNGEGGVVAAPFSTWAIGLPFSVMTAVILVFLWGELVLRLDGRVHPSSIETWGPMLGCTLLAFAVAVAFNYLGSHPDGLKLDLLMKPLFAPFCTLCLLGVESLKMGRRTSLHQ